MRASMAKLRDSWTPTYMESSDRGLRIRAEATTPMMCITTGTMDQDHHEAMSCSID